MIRHALESLSGLVYEVIASRHSSWPPWAGGADQVTVLHLSPGTVTTASIVVKELLDPDIQRTSQIPREKPSLIKN